MFNFYVAFVYNTSHFSTDVLLRGNCLVAYDNDFIRAAFQINVVMPLLSSGICSTSVQIFIDIYSEVLDICSNDDINPSIQTFGNNFILKLVRKSN